MTERDENEAVPDLSRDENEAQREKEREAWQSLIAAISERAERINLPANKSVFTAVVVDQDREGFLYGIRVNPANLTPEGKLKSIIADIFYQGHQISQWLIEAEWSEGKPGDITFSGTRFDVGEKGLGLVEIARVAESVIRQTNEIEKAGIAAGGLRIRTSNSYSNGIN